MPTLDWIVHEDVRVADQRKGRYLLINQHTGVWGFTNRSGLRQLLHWNDDVPQAVKSLYNSLFSDQSKPAKVELSSPECLFVIYKLTDTCNYRCQYCYDRKTARVKDTSRRDASIRAVLNYALEECGARVNLLFHGGEPLAEFPEIKALVTEYCAYGPDQLQFAVQTNASYLDQEILDFLNAYRIGLSVSVDGTTSSLNALRMLAGREDPYALLKRKIEHLSGLAPDRLGLLITVGKHNVTSLPEILVDMQADGFRSVSFSFMHEVHKGVRSALPEELVDALLRVFDKIAEGELRHLAAWTLIEWVRQVLYGRSELICFGSPCGAGNKLMAVFPSGEIGPCDSIFDAQYNSPDLTNYLTALKTGELLSQLTQRNVYTMESCRSCDVHAHCNGTCPGNAILHNHSAMAVAAHECAFHYHWIIELMRALSHREKAKSVIDYCRFHIQKRTGERYQV